TGAQRGCLVSLEKTGPAIVAEAHVDGDTVQPLQPPDPLAGALPVSVLTYVRRTGDTVVAGKRAAVEFPGDPYLERDPPRSLLCLPVARRGEPIALLYLEHRLLPDVFTPERLALLEVIAGQAATSLENATVFD